MASREEIMTTRMKIAMERRGFGEGVDQRLNGRRAFIVDDYLVRNREGYQ